MNMQIEHMEVDLIRLFMSICYGQIDVENVFNMFSVLDCTSCEVSSHTCISFFNVRSAKYVPSNKWTVTIETMACHNESSIHAHTLSHFKLMFILR